MVSIAHTSQSYTSPTDAERLLAIVHAVGGGGTGGEGQAAALDVVEVNFFCGHGEGAGETEDEDNEGGWKHGGIGSRLIILVLVLFA